MCRKLSRLIIIVLIIAIVAMVLPAQAQDDTPDPPRWDPEVQRFMLSVMTFIVIVVAAVEVLRLILPMLSVQNAY